MLLKEADHSGAKLEIETAERRIDELETLIIKIYEDQALGKLSAERYTALYNKYQEEQNALKQRVRDLSVTIADDKKEIRSASKFITLVDKYMDFTVLTPVILNEFVDKVVVHERDCKNSIQTTQKIEIYFNFIGEYKPSTMKEPELTEKEKAELARKEALKDKHHQQYMIRKAEGRDANYNKQVARRRTQQREDRRKTRRWEDIQAGIYHIAGTTVINAKNGRCRTHISVGKQTKSLSPYDNYRAY